MPFKVLSIFCTEFILLYHLRLGSYLLLHTSIKYMYCGEWYFYACLQSVNLQRCTWHGWKPACFRGESRAQFPLSSIPEGASNNSTDPEASPQGQGLVGALGRGGQSRPGVLQVQAPLQHLHTRPGEPGKRTQTLPSTRTEGGSGEAQRFVSGPTVCLWVWVCGQSRVAWMCGRPRLSVGTGTRPQSLGSALRSVVVMETLWLIRHAQWATWLTCAGKKKTRENKKQKKS